MTGLGARAGGWARAAGDRHRRVRTGTDTGFGLILVLCITMMVMIGVTSVLVSTAGNVVPAKHSQDEQTALAAAQAGIEDYVAFLNKSCTVFNNATCSAIDGQPVTARVVGADGKGTATFTRTVVNPSTAAHDGFVRLTSTGRSTGVSRTLVADIQGQPNVLRFSYLSKFETLSSDFLKSYYAARHITIPSNSAAPVSAVDWNAPTASGVGGVNVCDKLWYDSATNATSTTSAPTGADAGRATIRTQVDASLPSGTDWGAASTTSGVGTMYLPCEVTFTSGMTFTGPVYTQDAPYLSSGTTNGTGPTFQSSDTGLPAVSTAWQASATPAATVPYRTFPYLPTTPSPNSTGYPSATVQSRTIALSLPSNADDAKGGATCVYTGPTRVRVSGNTATVISPLTASGSGACYTNTNPSLVGTGITSAQVPVDRTTIYVQNLGSPSAWATASSSSPVFQLATPTSSTGTSTTYGGSAADANYTPGTGDNPSNKNDGAWTPQWTSYSTGSTCSTLTSALDLKFFNCYVGKGSYPDAYTAVKAAIKAAVTSNPSNYTTQSAFDGLVNNLVSTGNSSDGGNSTPANGSNASHRWQTSTVVDSAPKDGCTPGTSTSTGTPSAVASPTTDPLFDRTASGASTTTSTTTTTCLTTTVTAQIGQSILGLGKSWGDGGLLGTSLLSGSSIPQFRVTATITKTDTGTTVTATTAAFPNAKDVTPYGTANSAKTAAPGDLYVEGTGTTKPLSLVAEHDIVVTGPLTTSTGKGTSRYGNSGWTSGGAVALVADHNVRIYHPVSCVTASSGTSAGWCPNDITGLYTSSQSSLVTNADGTLKATHPAMQYCDMTTGTTANSGNPNSCGGTVATGSGVVSEIDAAVFALNGSLLSDNYNRGVGLGDVKVVGGIYQQHRGATGQQWEVQPDGGRTTSGYTLQDSYLDLEDAGLPYVPSLVNGSNSRGWNIVSLSAGS
jgi:hypothetical protein